MPFPDSDRVIYEKNPLVEVVCQLRFPRVLRIEAEKPVTFQEVIKDAYPVTNEQQIVGLRISGEGSMVSNVQQLQDETNNVFDFVSGDGKAKISLNSSFIAVSVKQYVTWGDFSKRLDFAFKAFIETYKPSFFERTGLRYINIIEPNKLGLKGVQWSEVLSKNLNSVFANLKCPQNEIKSLDGSFQCQFKEEGHFVSVRHGVVTNNATAEIGYKIDGDFWSQNRMEANLDVALTTLGQFRVGAGNLFRWSISNRLHEAMGPTEA